VAEAIELGGAYSRLHMRLDKIQHTRGQLARGAQLFDLVGGEKRDPTHVYETTPLG